MEYPILDGLGSVVALSDSSGSIVEGYSYDVYGAVKVHTAAGTDGEWLTSDDTINNPPGKSVYGNPYRFTGRRAACGVKKSRKMQGVGCLPLFLGLGWLSGWTVSYSG